MFKRSYANVMSTLAVFLVVAGGSAFAASTITANSIKSKAVVDNSLKSKDLKDGKAVSGLDVIDNSLTGDDVDESTLTQVPDSAQLGGKAPTAFLASSVYKAESPVAAGNALGDGTFVMDAACNPGDVLLSGGPANVNPTSDMVESFPTPGTTNAWTARINKHGNNDNFSVVVLCVDQTP